MNSTTATTAPVTGPEIERKIQHLKRLLEELWEKIKDWIGNAAVRTAIRTRLDALERNLDLERERRWNDSVALSETLDNMIVAVEKQLSSLSGRDTDKIIAETTELCKFLEEKQNNSDREKEAPRASFMFSDILKDFGPIKNVYQRDGTILIEGENKSKIIRITNGTVTEGEEDLHRAYVMEAEDVARPAAEIMADDKRPDSWIGWECGTGGYAIQSWNGNIEKPDTFSPEQINNWFRQSIAQVLSGKLSVQIGTYGKVLMYPEKTKEDKENETYVERTDPDSGKTYKMFGHYEVGHLTLTDNDTKTDSIEVSYDPVAKSIIGTYCETGSPETHNVFAVTNIGSDECTMKLNLPDPSFAKKWLLKNELLNNFIVAHGVNKTTFQKIIEEACENPGVNDFTHVAEVNYIKLEALEAGLKKRFKNDSTLDFFLKRSSLVERKGFDEKANVTYLRVTDSLRQRSYLIAFNEEGEAKGIYEKQMIGNSEKFVEIPKESNGIYRAVKAVEKDIANRESAMQNPQPQRNTPTSAKQPNELQRQQ